GPLARMIGGVASRGGRVSKYVTTFLKNGNLPGQVLFSTVGRTAARAIVTELKADVMMGWDDELASNDAHGDRSTWS
ncbi:nickel-dependent hydrogenase large subunit, partial [Aliarcobacter butzleri]